MTTPEEVNEATREFLREYPDAEAALSTLLERDGAGAWTFDDVEFDSGQFGELVSRGIAERTADGDYQLADADAVRRALAGKSIETDTDREVNVRSRVSALTSPRELIGVLGALAIVAGARLFAYGDVVRDGYVVSPANDPYFYRYWQAQLLARSDGASDLGLLADMGGAANSRPLTHAVNWWLAALLGGTAEAAATVAAWLPVIGAVALGCVLYLLAKLLTGDVRVGLAAVAFLGLAPVHVVYTNVGFLEHRLHQYFWLGVLALSLTWLAVDVQRRQEGTTDTSAAVGAHPRSPTSWAVAGVLALAVGASAHIWSGSPLTFIPVALYISLRVVVDVRAGISPIRANAPAIAGLAGGSVLALGLHLGLGWHDTIAAGTPLLVTMGSVAVAGVGEGWRQLELPARGLLATEGVVGFVGIAGLWLLEPVDIDRLGGRIEALLFREGATEAGTLFAAEYAFVLGPLWQIGISFYFGVAALAIATGLVARRYEPGWLLPVCFGWYYMLLAAFQARFAAQLVFFITLFAGVGCVYLLAAVDLARPFEPFRRQTTSEAPLVSVPGGRQSGYLIGTVCLLLVFNFIFVPTLVGQTTYSDEQFEAALAIEDHAVATDRAYPETAVETRWDQIRMYNYFVNGESGSYDSRYEAFLTADDPDERHASLRQGGKYVVITQFGESPGASYDILYNGLGVGDGDVKQTAGRYQPVYIGDENRVFTVVDGAVINVTGADGQQVAAATDVEIDGETIAYERRGVIEDGSVELRVAHPGEYTVAGATVTVTADDVYDGERVSVENS